MDIVDPLLKKSWCCGNVSDTRRYVTVPSERFSAKRELFIQFLVSSTRKDCVDKACYLSCTRSYPDCATSSIYKRSFGRYRNTSNIPEIFPFWSVLCSTRRLLLMPCCIYIKELNTIIQLPIEVLRNYSLLPTYFSSMRQDAKNLDKNVKKHYFRLSL